MRAKYGIVYYIVGSGGRGFNIEIGNSTADMWEHCDRLWHCLCQDWRVALETDNDGVTKCRRAMRFEFLMVTNG